MKKPLTAMETLIIQWLESRQGACQHGCDWGDANNVADAMGAGKHRDWYRQWHRLDDEPELTEMIGEELLMIDQIKLDELKRKLATVSQNTTFCIIDAPDGPCYYALDIDLLHGLVAAVENRTETLSAEEAYKEGFNEGWDECEERAEVTYGSKRGLAERAWERR